MAQPSNNKKGPLNDGNNAPQGMGKNLLLWLFLGLGVFSLVLIFQDGQKNETKVSYSEYREFLEKDLISSATIYKTQLNDYEMRGKLKKEITSYKNNKVQKIKSFSTKLGYLDSQVEKEWIERGIKIKYEEGDDYFWGTLLSLLPLILLFVLLMFFFRRMQNGGGGTKGIFSFGKARIRLIPEGAPKVTFDDVAGADEAKFELQEVIEFLKEPSKFKKLGGKIPKGVLLLGPPGTGKTLLARAVAGEAQVPFFSMSGADFVEMFVGVGASRVRDLFDQAKRNSPCIIFIDEIDAVGRQRGAGLGGGHDEREQTLNQLLVEMDGFEQNAGTIVIAATNRPDVLDPALLRPGRFDRQVVVDRPDVKGREGIFKVHISKLPVADDVDVTVLAKGTPGLAGADIANICNEAALFAARRNSDKVTMFDFENAKDKVLMGVERKSLVLSEKEKEITAYHEMGHALVGLLLGNTDPVHKVTIIPRGRALGVTSYLPNEEFHSKSKKYLEDRLAIMMGGRAAEKIVFDILSTGASNDIQRATQIAKRMVCEFGMSEKIGPVNYASDQEDVFLGRDISKPKDHSEKTAELIDNEVSRMLSDANARAESVLKENMELLHKTSRILVERELLDAEELDLLIKGSELPPVSRQMMNAIRSTNFGNGTGRSGESGAPDNEGAEAVQQENSNSK